MIEWDGDDPADQPTLTAGIRAGVAAWPNARVSFSGSDGDVGFTLAEMHANAQRVAAGLADLGLQRGDVLAMQLPSRPEAVLSCLAAAELGLTIAPIVHVYGESEVSFILEASGARAIVLAASWKGTDFLRRVRPAVRPASLEHVIVVGDDVPDGYVPWHALGAAGSRCPPYVAEPGDRALLLYTSGTTGHPKGVVHTQASIAAEIAQILHFNDGEDGAVTLVSFPIGHMAGVIGAVRAFYRDRHTIFMEAWDAAAAARLIDEHRVSNTAGTPFHMLSLFDAADRDGRSLDTIRSFVLGATTISPSLVADADARGISAFRCYGSTEQPTISCGRPSDSVEDRAGTDGRVLPGVEIRIVDDADVEVARGLPGEILSRGPDLTPGYVDPADDRAAMTADGWYRTGDIGTLDDRGFLTITDRKKDLIIRGGENIASKEVEDVLLTHASIREVAVVGVADDRYGERVCAVVVAADPSLTLEELRAHIEAAGLARQKAPESMVLVDDMPRTPSGKVQKHVLRRAIADGALLPGRGRSGTLGA